MAKKFTAEQLTDFGNYVLSNERSRGLRIKANKKNVTDADFQNWVEKQKA